MGSQALSKLNTRLGEIELLLQAHEALVKLRKAESGLSDPDAVSLKDALRYLQNLVDDVGPGRPPEVQAVNKAAVALLSAHLQGYLVDVHRECAHALLRSKVESVDAIIDEAPTSGNPNVDNITRLFASIGFPKVLDGVSWNRMSNDSVRKRLRELNELRNRIVHGAQESVQKATVKNYLGFVNQLTAKLDSKLGARTGKLTGSPPW
jgi:hypothetical protein